MIKLNGLKQKGARKAAKCVVVLSILFSLASVAFASTYSVDPSVIAYGARSVGMGRVSAALSFGSDSIFSNPAGTYAASPWGISSMSTKLLSRVSYQVLSGTYKAGNAMLGIGYVGVNCPAGYYTTDSGSLTDANPITYGDSTLALSYAVLANDKLRAPKTVGNLYFGTTVKLLNKGFAGSGVDGYTGSGYAADLGLILDNGEGFALGATLANILSSVAWASGYTEALESALTLGGSKTLMNNQLTVGVDTSFSFSNYPLAIHAGAEYNPLPYVSVRAGIDQAASTTGENGGTTSTNLTAGMGVNYQGFKFDYAYRSDSTLANNLTHYFSIGYAPELAKPVAAKDDAEMISTKNNYTETSVAAQNLGAGPSASAPSASANQAIDADLAELMALDK